jgi:hypothetical protein
MKKLIPITCLWLLFSSTVLATESSDAKSLFARYQDMGRAFDPSVADLYCDSAVIRNVRTYPSGETKTLELPATKYKALVRSVMPLAKARGDVSTFSQVRFVAEGENTRITAARFSQLKNYTSPVSILVGPCEGSGLAILEELSESQP